MANANINVTGTNINFNPNDNLKQFINSFEYDEVNYLSDFEPFEGNLFWAGNFASGTTKGGDLVKRELDNAQFRIQSISLPSVTINYNSENTLNRTFFTGIQRSKQISITWIEDAYMSVSKYHHDWLSNWYDLAHDCFMTGLDGKYRMLDIYVYHYQSEFGTAHMDPQVILKIELRGLVPQSVDYPQLSTSGGNYTKTVTYTVGQCNIFYDKSFVKEKKPTEVFNNKSETASGVWNPTLLSSPNNNPNGEAHRLAHSMILDINSEGMLN